MDKNQDKIDFPINNHHLLSIPIIFLSMTIIFSIGNFIWLIANPFSLISFQIISILFFGLIFNFVWLFLAIITIIFTPGLTINENQITSNYLIVKRTHDISDFNIIHVNSRKCKVRSFTIKHKERRGLSKTIYSSFFPKNTSLISRQIKAKMVDCDRIYYFLRDKMGGENLFKKHVHRIIRDAQRDS